MDKAKVKKILGTVANVLIWVFVVLSLLTTVLVFAAQGSEDGVPAIFGKSLITIETKSMEDTYKVGDLVFMKKLSDEDKLNLKVGDIITFRTSVDINGDGKIGDINTHRIHEHEEGSTIFVTKGDNNPNPDNVATSNTPAYTVHTSDIIGICKENGRIAGLGAVLGFLRSSLGFFLCIVLPLILFFLYELYNFIMVVVKERAKKAPAGVAPTVDEEEIKRRAIEEYLAAQRAKEAEEEIKRRAVEEYLASQKAESSAPKEETAPADEEPATPASDESSEGNTTEETTDEN